MLKDEERLIKLTLKGLIGPITVKGVKYPGQVPMTPFEYLLKDEEIAAVLTYTRNSFGNKASPITAEQVAEVRAAEKAKTGLYNVEDLLQEHPFDKNQTDRLLVATEKKVTVAQQCRIFWRTETGTTVHYDLR